MEFVGSIKGQLLRIFVDEGDRWKNQPLYMAIVEELRNGGFAGATVLKGIEGYGLHRAVHSTRVFDLSTNLPVLIEVIETPEKVTQFIPTLRDMIAEGLITIESVQFMRLSSRVK